MVFPVPQTGNSSGPLFRGWGGFKDKLATDSVPIAFMMSLLAFGSLEREQVFSADFEPPAITQVDFLISHQPGDQ